jgi:flagellin
MLGVTTGQQAKSTEKLSSGYQINRAADDAAGLSISEKMRRQIRGLTQASKNAEDGVSCVQTAEGALNEVHDMLQRINELAVKGENDTLQSVDRQYIASEITALMSEIDRVQSTTTFNNQNLLNGDFASGKALQVGAESGQGITIKISDMQVSKIYSGAERMSSGLQFFHSVTASAIQGHDYSSGDFHSLNRATKDALKVVSRQRSDLGAVQNRLEHTMKNLDNVVENTQAAESAIRDTDMATEMVRYSNNNILAQAGQSMLAQANQSNQGVLSLLG